MPEGTIVCNVEEKAGDRGSLARCSGADALPLLACGTPACMRHAGLHGCWICLLCPAVSLELSAAAAAGGAHHSAACTHPFGFAR